MKYYQLFEPTSIGKLQLKNKMSMAPMGPVGYANAFGGFNQRLQDYYVERARYGVGLIITGICSVDLNIEGIPSMGLPCPTTNPLGFIHSTTQMNERIHAYDAKIFLQLTGGLGRSALSGFTKNQIAISLFNQRTDEFGGCLENRLRVATEIVKGIKKACGPDFPVSLRYSLKSCMKGLRQGGLPGEDYVEVGKDIEEGIEAAKLLVATGYDALNVDAGTYDSWYWNHPPMYFEDGMYIPFGEILKKEVSVPIILAGRLENPELAIAQLGKSCDIVSYGRQLLADPQFVEKLKFDKLDEVRPCLGCHEGCLGRISNGPISCAVNPACGRESIYAIHPTTLPKNILVIGGGVAGLEVARVCATRGHHVTLCEKSNRLGGNLIPGGIPHFKRYDHELIRYYEKQMDLLGVTVYKNTVIDKCNYTNYNADIIVTATGSTARIIPFPGTISAVTAEDVLMSKIESGNEVVIVGGGLVGCETALWLAQQGKTVTVLEKLPEILGGHGALPHMNHQMLDDLLKFHNVTIHTNASIIDSNSDSITVKQADTEFSIPTETLISAIGYKENASTYNELKDISIPVYNVGDSRKVHNIMYAIWNAYELARELD